ncbi:hypothetical protein N7491_001515 [Penicillium cf. griseofulvum]|uniref:Major facilitator superfamily (MFS) profile domain-containing protein n=1 Tax=Penicillium cf. griseofulvum TaxID=2972120 RepID=A0A9W9JC52_9EURO|nr:hypothetical protein N7472_006646 [Penicillium cf. griseofulvum]KAJ5445433.1 hypothetical protein N7491_001515 [Penicillium cf. griseofulvum]KAJ5447153.1 hypothetical protein N7445_001974 [Penicillium cf. griseofulvum]
MTMGDLSNFKRKPRGKRAPWLLKFRSSTSFIIGAVWMSTFTIVPVMPTVLITRAGVEYDHREYWVSALLMSEAGTALLMCPVFGFLVDRGRTRRLPFIGALVILTACMLVLQLAHSIAAFVAARVLQGIAAALVVVASFALIGDAVAQERLGQTIGYLGSAIASGFLLGPFLGGIVYNSGGYNAVFWFSYPIIALDMVMRLVLIEKKVAAEWTGESNGDLESDLDTAQRIPSVGSHEPQVIQRRKGLVIFRMLKQRRVLISSWALLAQGILLSAFDATLPIFVETTFGWNSLGMGLIFLPMAVPAFFEPLFGSFTDRFGARFVAFGCFVLLSPTLICLRFIQTKSNEQIALLVSLLFLIGIFLHACAPAMYVEAQLALTAMELKNPGILGPKGAVAQGFGLQSMCQFAGVFFGPLWGGFVEYHFGWGAMTGTLGVLVALTAIPMLWLGESEEERALMS